MSRADYRVVYGFLFGVLVTLFYTNSKIHSYEKVIEMMRREKESEGMDVIQRKIHGFADAKLLEDPHHHMEDDLNIPKAFHDQGDEEKHVHASNRAIDLLNEKVRVLCWIMTHNSPKNLAKMKALNATWTQRCTKTIYFSTEPGPGIESVDLKFEEGRNRLWGKTKKVMRYLYDNYLGQYDWFLKADDDTFVIMENLRYMLSAYNSSEPHYLGCNFNIRDRFYNSGGAGYVLSGAAIKVFIEKGLNHTRCPRGEGGAEDLHLGTCLGQVGVNVTDTRDAERRLRFMPLSAGAHMNNRVPNWLETYLVYPYYHREKCCSESLVTFHYIAPEMMNLIEFLVYHVSVYGANNQFVVPDSLESDQVFPFIVDSSKNDRPGPFDPAKDRKVIQDLKKKKRI